MLFDRVKVATATTGTGTMTLGAAEASFRTLAQAGAGDGAPIHYLIEDGTAWEIGWGIYTAAGPTLTRNLEASSTGALIALTGAAKVSVTVTAIDLDLTTVRMGGAKGDGAVDDRAAFTRLDTQLVANKGLIVAGRHAIASNLTITRPLRFVPGGRLVVPTGVTITVNAPIAAPLTRIFELAGTGKVVLNTNFNRESFPEWWQLEGGGDWLASIQEAITNGMKTWFQRRDYAVSDQIVLNQSFKQLEGMGHHDFTGNESTRILRTGGTGTVMLIGQLTSPGPITSFVKQVEVKNLQLMHDSAAVPTASLTDATANIGLRVHHAHTARLIRVAGWENTTGFMIGGTVACEFENCYAKKSVASTTTVNDAAIGYYIDGSFPIGLAGGNASLYLKECKADIAKTLATDTRNVGFKGVDALADLFLIKPETVGCLRAIDLTGTGGPGSVASNADIHLQFPILDQPGNYGLVMSDFAHGSTIDIHDLYAGMPVDALAALYFGGAQNATFNLFGGGIYGTTPTTSTTIGVQINAQKGVNLFGLKIVDFNRPYVIQGASDFSITTDVNLRSGEGSDIFNLSGTCTNGSIELSAKSAGAGADYVHGVRLVGTACSDLRIDVTRVQAGVVEVAQGNVNINGRRIRFTGPYTSTGLRHNNVTTTGSIRVDGLPQMIATTLGDNSIFNINAVWNSATLVATGPWAVWTLTAAGTLVAAPLTTDFRRMIPRVTYAVPALAADLRQGYSATAICSRRAVGGGFYSLLVGAMSPVTSDVRFFAGLYGTTGAIAASTNPSALLNMIGIGKDSTDTNFSLMHNDGTGAATKVALPNTGAFAGITGDVIAIEVWALTGAAAFGYRVTRDDEAGVRSIDEGEITTDLPVIDTLFTHRWYMANAKAETAGNNTYDFIMARVETVAI